jgi:hypothetical protein
MKNPAVTVFRALTIGLLICSPAYCNSSAAESLVFRFEAERSLARIAPLEGSVTALAASMPKLSGTFGFETNTPVAAGSGIPGRVSFGVYDTWFVTIDAIDGDMVPGEFSVKVTDGVTQTDHPEMTIVDEVSLSARAVSPDAPVDAVTLRLRYLDAERLRSANLPDALNLDDIAEMNLRFSTRIDSISNRDEGPAATVDLLGLVHFDITLIKRVE